MTSPLQSYGRQAAISPAERRREVVERHASLVKRVALRIARMAPDTVEVDDLFAAGILGLLQASDSYDPAGGRAFEVYAEFRIKGAMLDELRTRDPLPRRTRHRVNLARRAISHTRLLRGRDPSDEELCEILQTDLAEIQDLRQYIDQPINVDAYDERVHVPMDLLPSDQLEESEQRELVTRGLDQLPDKHRNLLALYYDEGLNYKQIGEVFGVSEATVCRHHKAALQALRDIVHGLPAAQPAKP